MAKVDRGEGLNLRGKVGALVYCKRGKTVYAREWVKPANPQSAAQTEQRSALRRAIVAWQALTPAEKQAWKDKARREERTGYNLFVSEFLRAEG